MLGEAAAVRAGLTATRSIYAARTAAASVGGAVAGSASGGLVGGFGTAAINHQQFDGASFGINMAIGIGMGIGAGGLGWYVSRGGVSISKLNGNSIDDVYTNPQSAGDSHTFIDTTRGQTAGELGSDYYVNTNNLVGRASGGLTPENIIQGFRPTRDVIATVGESHVQYSSTGHGNSMSSYITVSTRRGYTAALTPEQYADVLLKQSLRDGEPIKLIICYAGRGRWFQPSVAQRIATALDRPVYAHDEVVTAFTRNGWKTLNSLMIRS